MKIVTLGEVIDAIEKNGFPQAYKTYYRFKKAGESSKYYWNPDGTANTKNLEEACAIGQAAINLGTTPEGLFKSLDLIAREIVTMNDGLKMSLPDIAHRLRKEYKNSLGAQIHIP